MVEERFDEDWLRTEADWPIGVETADGLLSMLGLMDMSVEQQRAELTRLQRRFVERRMPSRISNELRRRGLL